MPGIVGIISQKPSDECQRLVRSMLGSMEGESFYRSGTHFVPELGVYGGWVSLEGSFAANQVFINEPGDVALLLAGECFPDPGLEVNRNGDSDAGTGGSWLLKLYEEAGDQFFERLNGLFSGLLIDKRRHRAFLFNDRYASSGFIIARGKTGSISPAKRKRCSRFCRNLGRSMNKESRSS
jgi:asparagine synthase (glutamine-hydrolysing)